MKNLDKMTKDELVKEAKRKGLNVEGLKKDEVKKKVEKERERLEKEKETINVSDEKTEVKIEVEDETKKEPDKFGVHKIVVAKIEEAEVDGTKYNKVYLADGTTQLLSDSELEQRLEEGKQ